VFKFFFSSFPIYQHTPLERRHWRLPQHNDPFYFHPDRLVNSGWSALSTTLPLPVIFAGVYSNESDNGLFPFFSIFRRNALRSLFLPSRMRRLDFLFFLPSYPSPPWPPINPVPLSSLTPSFPCPRFSPFVGVSFSLPPPPCVLFSPSPAYPLFLFFPSFRWDCHCSRPSV